MDRIGIYQIKINKKIYVGSTVRSFKIRLRQHLNYLRNNNHPNKKLQNSFNKYGENNLEFTILEVIEDKQTALFIEQKYIDELKPNLNVCPIAGNSLGRELSEETKNKISKSLIGNKRALGMKHSEETKKIMKQKAAGNKHALGYKHTEEDLKKMRESHIGLKNGLGGKSKLGQKLSDKTKRKISENKKEWWKNKKSIEITEVSQC